VDWAAVPEAPSNLHDEPRANEHDVVASASLAEYRMVYPVAKAAAVEFAPKRQLWASVTSALGFHPTKSFG
jgi:hypothetical protein